MQRNWNANSFAYFHSKWLVYKGSYEFVQEVILLCQGENEYVFRSRNCSWSEHFCVLSLSSVWI